MFLTPKGPLLSPSRCLCDPVAFQLVDGLLVLGLHPGMQSGLTTYFCKYLFGKVDIYELVLNSFVSLGLAFPSIVRPLPVAEVLGSAPSVVPVGGATSKKRRLPLLFFRDGGSHCFHLVHHLLPLLGKLRSEK